MYNARFAGGKRMRERESRASEWPAVVVSWLVARGLKPAPGEDVAFYFIFDVCFERESDGEGEKEIREAEKKWRRRSREDEGFVCFWWPNALNLKFFFFSFFHFFFHFGAGWHAIQVLFSFWCFSFTLLLLHTLC